MEYELKHYGVKGMKWGVRRYQNSDGTLTAAGKKRARQEVRSDNKTAHELGRTATITGYATAKSMKRTIKLENKIDKKINKDPDNAVNRTKKLREKWEDSAKTTMQLADMCRATRNKAEKHCKELIDKYGAEAISSIKYKDIKLPKGEYSPSSFKTMNENTNNWKDYAVAAGITFVRASCSMLLDLPVYLIQYPTSTQQKAAQYEMAMYYRNRRDRKKGG